ncbi:MAG TPA: SDR family NAD(P)-dependent oxidoreductase [Nocardioidaceae bacterium]|nr:SDR family NAD(P)-dependent oxidoreductase [Nocardioidaceae bacterium]
MSRRVLVTGGRSGLGAALVRQLRAAGDRVLVTDLADRGPSVEVGDDYLRLDVRNLDDWLRAREWVEQRWGGLDLLVNNAGVAAGGRIDVADVEEWQRVLDVNLLGVARGCHVFVPVMKRQRSGHIVNVASMAGLVYPPNMSSYNAAKAGVVALSETLLHELEPFGIAVTVVCPSFFRTNLSGSLRGRDEEAQASARRLIDGSRRSPEDVARQVVAAVQHRRFLLITDRMGRAAYLGKRFARPMYHRVMRTVSRSFARRTRR